MSQRCGSRSTTCSALCASTATRWGSRCRSTRAAPGRRSRPTAWTSAQADGLTIGLNGRESEKPGGEGGAVIALRSDGSIDDEVARLEGQGVDFAGGIADRPWGRVAALHDPDGNVLELYEPPS